MALELAQRLDAEIVSLDSMAIYRGMDIGTAKPTAAEQAAVPHHLLDVVDPADEYSVAQYVADAAAVVDAIRARGREVLFVGGTPLYLKSLLRGLFDGPPANWELREEIEAELEQVGQAALHERLTQVDPLAASVIHPHDTRRMIRALEVFRATGEPMSHQQMEFEDGRAADECRVFVLRRERGELHRRIEGRVEAMIDVGLVDEVRQLDGRRQTARPDGEPGGRLSRGAGLSGRRDRRRTQMRVANPGPDAAVCQAARDLVPQSFRMPVCRHCGRSRRGGDRRTDCGGRISVICARNRPSNDNAICSDRSIWGGLGSSCMQPNLREFLPICKYLAANSLRHTPVQIRLELGEKAAFMKLFAGSLACVLLLSGHCFALRTYHVGNSLTYATNAGGLANWVASRGGTHPYGFHINNGAKLQDIWTSPNYADSAGAPYGTFGNALPNYEWDVLTLEPFGANITDAEMVGNFVGLMNNNPNNHDAQVYLYESWPTKTDIGTGTYSAFWEQPWAGTGFSATVRTRDYFQKLTDQVNATEMGLDKDILIVPVGDVLNSLDKRMRAGDIPGFASGVDLYRDDVHFKEGVGYFAVSTAFYATLYHDNPMGLAIPASMTSTVTPEFAAIVQRVVWDVVAGHPYSGVSGSHRRRLQRRFAGQCGRLRPLEVDLWIENGSTGRCKPRLCRGRRRLHRMA